MAEVQTVQGPVDAQDLGIVLAHEHVRFRDEADAEQWPGRYDEQLELDAALVARIAAGLDGIRVPRAVGGPDFIGALPSERPTVPLTATDGELPELIGHYTAVADWYRAAVDQVLSGEPVLSSDGRGEDGMSPLDEELDEILSAPGTVHPNSMISGKEESALRRFA